MQNIKKVLVNHRDFFFFIFLGCFGLKAAYANGKKIVVPLDFFLYRSYQFYLQANTGFEHRTSEYWGDHATTISAGKLSEWNSYFCFSVIALEYNTIVQNKERKNGATLSHALWSDLPYIVQKLTITWRKVINTSQSC